ncbi:MAG: thermonuclease family protein [Candidatus Vogelbacteria bacterium]|nr:thermonuclease family protein [Candidatus Vogelbacteria bacterium]
MNYKKISFSLFLVLAVSVFGKFYFENHVSYERVITTARTNVSIVRSNSVEFEYGQPIKVERVVDGDTVQLESGERLRYIGIDTPEEFDPRKPIQCFAKEATDRNRDLVEGKTVTVYKDVSTRDKYGRLLGFVYLSNGTFVNSQLVREGFAFNYPYQPDTSKAKEFKESEEQARKSRFGLWKACSVHGTKSGREQTNTL